MLLFLNIISMYIEALVPLFHKPQKTSSLKFFGLLSEPGVDWDHEGIVLTAFQPQGQTVNADSYCNILRKLRKAIQWK
jgi:hypothetical protein